MRQIPLSPIPAQTLQVVLSGRYCTISLYWRQSRLYLDLSAGGAVICQGAICQNRADVLQSKHPDFSGALHFYDLQGDRPPGWEGLHNGSSGRWMLLYAEEGEVLPEVLKF